MNTKSKYLHTHAITYNIITQVCCAYFAPLPCARKVNEAA